MNGENRIEQIAGLSVLFVLVFLGVFGGVITFGFLGIFLGPTLLATGYEIVRDWAQDDPPSLSVSPSSS